MPHTVQAITEPPGGTCHLETSILHSLHGVDHFIWD